MLSFFKRSIANSLIRKSVVRCMDLTIMNARETIISKVFLLKSIASNKSSHLSQRLPFYFILAPPT